MGIAKKTSGTPASKSPRSLGITFCAVIFFFGGFLSLASTIKSLSHPLRLSHLQGERLAEEYAAIPFLERIIPAGQLAGQIEYLRREGVFEVFDRFVSSGSYQLALWSTVILSLIFAAVGAGLFFQQNWARLGSISLHVLLLPLALYLTERCVKDLVQIMDERYEGVSQYIQYLPKILIAEGIILFVAILPVIIYFQLPGIKRQFTG